MIGELNRPDTLAAKGAMVYGAIGITRDLSRFAVLGIDQNAATAVTHSAVALNHGIITINFHLFLYIGIEEFTHTAPFLNSLS
jgi:hypothetical protein